MKLTKKINKYKVQKCKRPNTRVVHENDRSLRLFSSSSRFLQKRFSHRSSPPPRFPGPRPRPQNPSEIPSMESRPLPQQQRRRRRSSWTRFK